MENPTCAEGSAVVIAGERKVGFTVTFRSLSYLSGGGGRRGASKKKKGREAEKTQLNPGAMVKKTKFVRFWYCRTQLYRQDVRDYPRLRRITARVPG